MYGNGQRGAVRRHRLFLWKHSGRVMKSRMKDLNRRGIVIFTKKRMKGIIKAEPHPPLIFDE